jgi:formate hydrogenlyase subunit 3/multisubunit Na+/H+ antiporter MnhD subunit
MTKEISQLLPWIPFIPLVASLIFLLAKSNQAAQKVIFALGTLPGLALGCVLASLVITPAHTTPVVLTAWEEFFCADGLSVLMILCTFFFVFAVGVYSFPYIRRQHEEGRVTERGVRLYFFLLLVFCSALTWMVISNNLLVMFVAIEVSTIVTALLIALYKTRPSLEAAFKYNMLLVMAIMFALMGTVLIFAEMAERAPGLTGIHLLEIGRVAALIPAHIALTVVALFICAFGTKGGMFPFHAWLPDAHSEAPAPISALLSGVVVTIGAYCLVRVVSLFTSHYQAVVILLAAMASVSILVGILMAIVQDDLKRLLAYSTISQIAYIFEGIGLGTYLGIYGGLFHAFTHLLAKGLLFFCAGAIIYRLDIRRISELGGLSRKMPFTALCFFIGGFSMGSVPLFAGFMSKYTIILAIGKSQIWWAMGISAVGGLLTLVCMVWAAYRVFWGAESEKVKALQVGSREMPPAMMVTMLSIAVLIIVVGLYPAALYPLLDSATRSILAVFSM